MAVSAVLVGGCAAGGGATPRVVASGMARAPLASNDGARFEVRYQASTGQCSAGALQLVARDELRGLDAEWDETGDGCSPARKLEVPASADYPALLQARGVSGGAHVLVRIDREGRVHDARAVCASDERFAAAAEATARAIAYAPATCAGEPRRAAFLLPFNYDI
ncbi:TonB family protein [Luteimonas sp. MC1895]|uniref:TonB family protein n=1 Tax=Luteimonas sp. MC1895 TaxID=2819513 RepID=UPI0018F0D052|nr:TonB family protein [Luteimonas sp. MC1895]MBJ6980265.1 TonB family protein [Luteimonas sp. MC1895]